MNRTKGNIIANLAGRSTAALLGIISVPFYLHYVSVEMYGIIGFFASIQAFLFLLDGGISPTLNREVARLSALPEKGQELRNLSHTLEIVCWSTGLLVSIIALVVSPIAANYWLRSDNIPTETISHALMIMSVTLAFQWASTFYMGGLYGLQEQKVLNIVNVLMAIFRSFGAVFVLAYISPTITAFVVWQLVAAVVNCLLLALVFWRKLPATPGSPSFKPTMLKEVWRYAVGMAGISVTALILTQTDKIILSKILTLEDFGYYTLAVTLAGSGIAIIVGSIQTVYFPQFSQLVAQNKLGEIRDTYHRACQVMSFFLVPAVSILAFFSYEILIVWTRNLEIAERTYIILTLIALGTGLNGLMHLPYYAQLAFGITKISFWQNVVVIILLVPFMIYTAINYGAVGGALSWTLINLFYTVVGLQVMHRVILKGELKRWYLDDTLKPIIVVGSFLFAVKSLVTLRGWSSFEIVSFVCTLAIIVVALTALTLPTIRDTFCYYFKRMFRA